MNTPINVGILGSSGKMGRALIKAVSENDFFLFSGGSSESSQAENSLSPESLFQKSDVLIDFSTIDQSLRNAKLAEQYQKPLVIGTTGFSNEQLAELKSQNAPLFLSYNMSIGINVLQYLAEEAAQRLDSTFDIEIIEAHHRYKKDAPSGTAFMIQESLKAGRNTPNLAIPTHSLRGGSVVGDHTVVFLGNHERLEIKHVAEDRSVFAFGALKAAAWMVGKTSGFYSMKDLLNRKK